MDSYQCPQWYGENDNWQTLAVCVKRNETIRRLMSLFITSSTIVALALAIDKKYAKLIDFGSGKVTFHQRNYYASRLCR